MRKIDMNKRYRHFKGFEVTPLSLATNTETGEIMVVYSCDNCDKALHNKNDNGIFARPLDMFLSEVDRKKYPDVKQKYRFEEIE